MSAKTTWEDLSRLGWPINDVLQKANAQRGGTMKGQGDLSLNDGVAAQYQWWSYNTIVGQPYVLSKRPNKVSREETAWSYDNTHNSKPFETQWTETWSSTTSATLSVSTSASITLSNHITILDVASSGFDISISTEKSSSETKERHHDLSQTWTLNVGPGEKLSLIRVITTSSEVSEYGQDFGLDASSRVGTKGKKYNGHYYWAMNLNDMLGHPHGRMNLQGDSKSVSYAFKLVREGSKGRTMHPLHVNLYRAGDFKAADVPVAVMARWDNMAKDAIPGTDPVQIMTPGPDDAEEEVQ